MQRILAGMSLCLVLMMVGCGGGTDSARAPQAKAPIRLGAVAASTEQLLVAGYRANFVVVRNPDGTVTISNKLTGEVVSKSGLKLIKFFDKYTSFDLAGPAGQVYRLYQAAFDRKPDLSGLGFWINATQNGASMRDIADAFISSEEFQLRYGKNVANDRFVTLLYNNILHRVPEQGGFDWWLDVVNKGAGRQDVLFGFSDSPENKGYLFADMGNGVDYLPYGEGGPIVPQPSSYENKNNIPVNTAFPGAYDPSMDRVRAAMDKSETGFNPRSLSFGDFLQNGKYSAFVVANRYTGGYPGNNPAKWPDAPAKVYFLSQESDGSWSDVSSQLLPNASDRYSCITPSYSIVADFNNDGKPDVYIACTGIDFQLNGVWTKEQASDQHLYLSQKGGGYRHVVLPIGKIYGHQATAFDIDGDGRVDIVTADPIINQTPLVLWGNGDGSFRMDTTRFPLDMFGKAIYGVVGVPIDGKMGLLVSGNTPGSGAQRDDSEYGTTLLSYEAAAFVYKADLTPKLPLTSAGYKFGLALDHLYWNGYLYSYHVSYGYDIDGITKTKLATGDTELIYTRKISDFGQQLVEIAMRPDGKIVLFGSMCNRSDVTAKLVCAYQIDR